MGIAVTSILKSSRGKNRDLPGLGQFDAHPFEFCATLRIHPFCDQKLRIMNIAGILLQWKKGSTRYSFLSQLTTFADDLLSSLKKRRDNF